MHNDQDYEYEETNTRTVVPRKVGEVLINRVNACGEERKAIEGRRADWRYFVAQQPFFRLTHECDKGRTGLRVPRHAKKGPRVAVRVEAKLLSRKSPGENLAPDNSNRN